MRSVLGFGLMGAALYAFAFVVLEKAAAPPPNVPAPLVPGYTEL